MALIISDMRLALRSWRKAPTLTAIVMASIALGIGAKNVRRAMCDVPRADVRTCYD